MSKVIACTTTFIILILGIFPSYSQITADQSIQALLSETYNEKVEYQISSKFYNEIAEKEYVYINQSLNGIPVYGSTGIIVFNDDNNIVYSKINFDPELRFQFTPSLITPIKALTIAADQCEIQNLRISDSEQTIQNSYKITVENYFEPSITVKEILYNLNSELISCYQILLFDSNDHLIETIINKMSGEIVIQHNLTPQCSVGPGYMNNREVPHFHNNPAGLTDDGATYLAYSSYIENPLKGNRRILVEPADPIMSPFGWHDLDGEPGADTSITYGNNVYAYPDRNGDDYPDSNISGGDSLYFVFDKNLNDDPIEYLDASTTNLFVINNQLHDILAHNGFDESTGNFQHVNYTGAPGDEDEVLAHAQSRANFGPLNNATFSTRPDGTSGIMRMFTWRIDDNSNKYLRVEEPFNLRRRYSVATTLAGPSLDIVTASSKLVMVNDSTNNINDGCDSIINKNSLRDKIAVIELSDSCSINAQIYNAQEAGAIGVILLSSENSVNSPFSEEDSTILIPSVMTASSLSEVIRENINELEVTLSQPQLEVDGSFDQGVITHELTHGVSNRLIGGRLYTMCLNNEEQMGEGWSDIIAMIITMREEDLQTRVRSMGAYVRNEHPDGLGIRNVLYSPNREINDYTYGDVASTGGQVHNMGEIWATFLLDIYFDLVDKYGYDPDLMYGNGGNRIALRLIIEGMKLTQCNPGFVDGRDGIIEADKLIFGGKNQKLLWEAFADRGLGFKADQGSSYNYSDGIEDFSLPKYINSFIDVNRYAPEIVAEDDTIKVNIQLTNYLKIDTLETIEIVEYIPEYTTYVDGSSDESITVTNDSLIFLISLNDFDSTGTYPTYSFNYELDYDESRKNKKLYVDSMNYTNLDQFKVYHSRRNNISLRSDLQGDTMIQLNGDVNFNLQYINLKEDVSISENDRTIMLFGHSHELTENTGVNIKLKDINGNFVFVNPLLNGYKTERRFITGAESVFTGQKRKYLTVLNLEELGVNEVNYRISQYINEPSPVDNYSLTDVAIWQTDVLRSNSVSKAGDSRYLIEDISIVEPAIDKVSQDEYNLTHYELYPNPASDIITINSNDGVSNLEIKIYDIKGRMIKHLKDSSIGNNPLEIDISDLTNGVHVLEVITEKNSQSFKFNKM